MAKVGKGKGKRIISFRLNMRQNSSVFLNLEGIAAGGGGINFRWRHNNPLAPWVRPQERNPNGFHCWKQRRGETIWDQEV